MSCDDAFSEGENSTYLSCGHFPNVLFDNENYV